MTRGEFSAPMGTRAIPLAEYEARPCVRTGGYLMGCLARLRGHRKDSRPSMRQVNRKAAAAAIMPYRQNRGLRLNEPQLNLTNEIPEGSRAREHKRGVHE